MLHSICIIISLYKLTMNKTKKKMLVQKRQKIKQDVINQVLLKKKRWNSYIQRSS